MVTGLGVNSKVMLAKNSSPRAVRRTKSLMLFGMPLRMNSRS